MKTKIKLMLVAAFFLPLCTYAQSNADTRAAEGEQVWLIVNYVKGESKQAYESYMEDVFFKALSLSNGPKRAEQNQHTRWLTPAQQNEDGTWTYVFIMDPVVTDANYDIEQLFREQYSAEKSAELLRQYESYISKTDVHILVQSKQ